MTNRNSPNFNPADGKNNLKWIPLGCGGCLGVTVLAAVLKRTLCNQPVNVVV